MENKENLVVKGGNINYVFGDAVDERRIQAWRDAGKPLTGKPDENAFAFYVSYFDVEANLNEFFRRLHDAIAKLYVKVILFSDIAIKVNNEKFSSNYTPAMTKLRNISFDGATNVRGYCPFEPKVRLMELLNYPIDKFNFTLPEFVMTKFTIPTQVCKDTDFEQIKPSLVAYERYCGELCKKIEAYIKVLDELRSQINNFD